MYRYFTVKDTLGYLPVLPDLVKGYNTSYHHTIGMAPNQVNLKNEREVWDRMYSKRLSKKSQKGSLKVKDNVRLNKKFYSLRKGIYQDAPKKYLSCNVSYLAWFPLTKLRS